MSSKLVFAKERLQDIVGEMMPLFEAHRQEVSLLDAPLDPDWKAYSALEEFGILSVFTARDQDGALAGYAAFIVHRHLHYNIVSADQDVLYLRPEYRKGFAAIRLIRFAEKQLAAMGATIVTQHSKLSKDLTGMFSFMGYVVMDQILFKRL